MCCKTGAQFDYWYRAREAGEQYSWYCHFDDDLYVNPQALVNLLKSYDPTTDHYIGAWNCAARVHHQNRIPVSGCKLFNNSAHNIIQMSIYM